MSPEGSITRWIADLELGNSDRATKHAQEELWSRYFRRLMRLGKIKLGDTPRAVADEEDVAISALQSFFHSASLGRFPKLHDRNSLWPLLAKITANKAIDQRRRLLAKKQGAGKVRGHSAIFGTEDSPPDWPDAILDEQLRPDFLVAMAERCQHLMDRLRDDQMREIARRKLEGYTNAEIANQLGVVERTVERRLGMIRDYWSREGGEDQEKVL
jgi:DNA-directed RNA polymerase specialized sigma24 family protein